MNKAIITTKKDDLSVIFWNSYFRSNGPNFDLIITLPDKSKKKYSLIEIFTIIKKFFSIFDILKLICRKLIYFNFKLSNTCDKYIELSSYNEEKIINILIQYQIGCLFSLGSPIIFSDRLLAICNYNFNLHNGDIRKYRGHFSTFWEFYHHEDNFFLTLHEMSDKVDKGNIYILKSIKKSKRDSFYQIMIKKKELGGHALANFISNNDFFKEPDYYVSGVSPKHYPFPSIEDIQNII
jgi:hypothetical protein